MALLPKADAILSGKVNLLNGHGDHLFWHEYALVLIRFSFFLLVPALGAHYEVNKHWDGVKTGYLS